MTKKVFILLLSALMGVAQAQTSMTVPYGSFEQWTSHPGYDISAVFLTMPMYNSFSTPTGWDYLSYPVNESLSLGFQTIAVNTMLPLIVASQETGAVPDGNSAVKLQTFMLTDIINSTVYSLASGLIDTALANTVYPQYPLHRSGGYRPFYPDYDQPDVEYGQRGDDAGLAGGD